MSFREPQIPGIGLTGQFTTAEYNILINLAAGSGGGVFLEIPSGTVDGVNKAFTVQNNPLFEEVSGQVMVSSAQDSTNNGYVVSGSGPYTVTFGSAPTIGQTPHSFYVGTITTGSLSSYFQTDPFTSSANQTVFTTSLVPVFVLSFVVNGQPQTLTTDYTHSGSIFTLNSSIQANLPVTITYIHN